MALALPVNAAERFIAVASTTSTENSGLFKHLLPQFQQATGIEVRVVAVGTGQAIKNAERGDADVLFVHHRPSEEAFVAQGFGVARRDVMYNDYVLLGPQPDPAGINGMKDAVAALARIAAESRMTGGVPPIEASWAGVNGMFFWSFDHSVPKSVKIRPLIPSSFGSPSGTPSATEPR